MAEKPTATKGAAPVNIPPRLFSSKVAISDVGYRKADKAVIADLEQKYFNTSVKDLRTLSTTSAIRILTRTNGTFSAALNGYLQIAMSGYKAIGYTAGTNQFDPAATLAAQSTLASFDTLFDYTAGYSTKPSMDGLLETLLKEVLQTGACMAELVLNKFKLPEQLIPIPVTTIEWVTMNDGRRFPQQVPPGGGDKISLDYPTIFYASAAQQSNSIFPRSMFESALNMLYLHEELMEDIFRVIRRTGHSRMVVKVVQEAVQKMATPDVQADSVKMATFFNDVRTQIENTLSNLNPEDAVVLYDSAEIDSLSSAGDKADYTAILDTMNGMLASSLKTMPSMLGFRITGSQSLSNTESLTFLKFVEGIRRPVETVMSRALTLAVRLTAGTDSYVKFEFDSIELRPEGEMSAHKSVMQQEIMRKLSLGYLTDDEAAHMMGSFPRAPGAPNLSGTGFMPGTAEQVQPKDMTTAQDGAAQKSNNEGTSNGPAKSNGGGNPKG
jgi:hypothetical protein